MRHKLLFAFILSLVINPVSAQTLEDESVAWLQDLIRIDTINPPGNESRAVDFYARIFEAEGIEYETAESAPGRGNIWARLEGGDEPGLILLQHTDVVPAEEEFWTIDPLSGDIRDGYILGRGTRDMKGLGILQLAAFLSLHRSGVELNRDIIFLATADEEAGGYFGVGWLIDNRPDIFDGAGILLNEGGGGSRSTEGDIVFGVEVTQKVPVWLRLNAIDTPGHGSSPRTTSSVTRIVQALNMLLENPFPPRIIGPVAEYFSELSIDMDEEWGPAYADIAAAIGDPAFVQKLHEARPGHNSLVRDTCSMTRLSGSSKINVIPPQAWAELDCRILPDKPSEVFIAELQELIAGTGVEIETIMAFTPAISETSTRLFAAIVSVTQELHPGSRVLLSVSTGFTDSHFTRDFGIVSYGFNPLITDSGEHTGVHGNDEQVGEAAFRRAVGDFYAVVRNVVID
ncbi:MAG: M20/M25/M40 family metallo-hydrolase [Gammaproteobacteria bacterium]|jgi:acetylornithine deacetylase/succinyl-diaminopimelate desuccinylase-like protein|nr:M20/M25/M40 family metallo-hydrolase [Gammaproteobacteria bacterium]MDP6731399.1 M20/M25/M40 family metallo-hydrolase [Gammaproteobacteria bacterium]